MKWSDVVRQTAKSPCMDSALELEKGEPTEGSRLPLGSDSKSEEALISAKISSLCVDDATYNEQVERVCVLDAGFFLHTKAEIKLADRYYTVPNVLKEIRDARHRHMLENLTFELTVQSPSLEFYEMALKETQRTGDFGFLSDTDLSVIALTMQLSEELHSNGEWDSPVPEIVEENMGSGDGWITSENIHTHGPTVQSFKEGSRRNLPEKENDTIDTDLAAKDSDRPCVVACFTTDFTIQNSLVQLGLPVIGPQGRQIRHVKTWILRCHACYTLVTDTTRQFCPSCGSGNTLKRVSYSVDAETGEKHIWINEAHRIVTRGQRYNLPKPRWGAHGTNRTLVLREDQLRDFGMPKSTKNKRHLRDHRKSLSESYEFGEKHSHGEGHQKLEKSSYKSFNVNERRKLMASRRK
ncbi:hypothetical protein XU18_2920 [Perkinsela sp. CCAP 1560/4]|nr:hypothetical protein XU18_2920 [Perkinsela sp. CCAP 1560/4]|eukprot:KNH06415.1 hypothetical protein XU18_2920 [Perkinsela sp. CCAP 1560/4]